MIKHHPWSETTRSVTLSRFTIFHGIRTRRYLSRLRRPSVPTYFVNGRLIRGTVSFEELDEIVSQER